MLSQERKDSPMYRLFLADDHAVRDSTGVAGYGHRR